MKNAKSLCKKHVPTNYKLAMRSIGLLASATSLQEMDAILTNIVTVFGSPKSAHYVKYHFKQLQHRLCTFEAVADDQADNFETDVGPTSFSKHFKATIDCAPLDDIGNVNAYYAPDLITSLELYWLPQAPLWSGMLLGDLGRHGDNI
ncbi:unnamed protein product [Knipowitschia caucasica]